MKIFQVQDLRIASLTIIADDVHHASHIFLQALYKGMRHWPDITYTIGEYEPVHAKQTEAMRKWAQEHKAGIVHRCNDGGWELIPLAEED